jgi:MFS family permease
MFVVAGFFGRMHMSMMGLAIVLLVSSVTGSYGTAGAVAATSAVAYATVAPFVGTLADRHGQRRVLLPIGIGHAAAVTTLAACAMLGAPLWTMFPAAAATGGTSASLGSMVRARWIHHLGGTAALQAAFSVEAVADEIIFIVGPIIVTSLATAVHPIGGVIAAGTMAVCGTIALALQVRTQPTPRPRPRGGSGSAITVPGLRVLMAVFLLAGSVFAAIEVSVVAFAQGQQQPAAAGFVLASFALGSMVTALWYGARRFRSPLERRFLIGLLLFAAGCMPLPFVTGLVPLGVVIFFSGLAISPTIVPGLALVQRLVPEHQRTEGLTWVSTSIGVGVATGASLSGRLIDEYGTTAGFVMSLAGASLAATVGLAGMRLLRRPAADTGTDRDAGTGAAARPAAGADEGAAAGTDAESSGTDAHAEPTMKVDPGAGHVSGRDRPGHSG